MKVVLHKKFEKRYWRCTSKIRMKIDETIVTFRSNPLDKSLKNHRLDGHMDGKRAISVTGDIRIVFKEYNDYVLVIMLDVGTHNQVYGS